MSEKFEVGKRVSATFSPLRPGSASASVIEVSQMSAAIEIMSSAAPGYSDTSSNLFHNQANQAYQENFYERGQAMGVGLESAEQHSGYLKDEADEDEENQDEHGPLKLFVGQVPRTMSEEDLFSTFTGFGPIKELMIIRDRHTGQHRGCAFVTFYHTADGLKAVEDLHDKVTLSNGRKPLQVRPANENPSNVPAPPLQENKLFIGMTSRNADENSIRELFSPFGEIREIYLIRNADGSNKGCAFLKYEHAESAMAAIEALNEKVVMEGASRALVVKYADSRAQKWSRQRGRGRGPPFYHPPAFSMYGYQQQTQQGPPMGVPPPLQYNQQYPPAHFPLGNPPHYDMYMHRGPYGYPASVPFSTHGGVSPIPPGSRGSSEGYDGPPVHSMQQQIRDAYNSSPRPREGPAGANLFIYHLPHDLTDADLATAFNPFGQVISAKVYVDKYTRESKGFGFVSYDSRQAAEAAIEQMNGFQIGSKRLKVQHKRIHTSPRMPQYFEDIPSNEGGAMPMMPSLHDSMVVPMPHYPAAAAHLEDPDALAREMERLKFNQYSEEE